MNKIAVKILALAAVLVPMFGIGNVPGVGSLGASVALADVSVYRGLQRKNATYAKVATAQFRIDNDGLSTFEAAQFATKATTRQCKLQFTIEGVNSQPNDGTQGDIDSMAGYQGTYTSNLGGTGHWSIKNTNRTNDDMAQDFVDYAIATQRITVNADYAGGSASRCDTPDAAN